MTRLFNKASLFFLILCSISTTSYCQGGVLPVFDPTGGFNFDGYLQRQGAAGDWLAGPGGNGIGTFIFNDSGNSRFGLHFIDRWNDDSDNVFFKGRLNDDPNTMKWILKKAQAKGDMNHTMGFLTSDGGRLWLVFAGDRFTTGGTTYLDFELSQKSIVRVGNSDNGGFYSFGKNGGRTVGDLLVSVKFSKDLTAGKVTVYQWTPAGNGGFEYFQLTNSPSNVISAVNTTSVNVPYGAFGSTVYQPYTFAELAVEISVMGGSCSGAEGYRTARMLTRANDAYGSFIDFAEETQLPINPLFSVSVDYIFYDLQHAQLTANITPGPVEDYNFFWLPITPLTGSLSDPNIYNPVFTAGISDYCLSYIYELYVYRKSDNCLVSITPVVINAPCKIGKPINPDRPNLTQDQVREEGENQKDVLVYPNPSKGAATISFPVDNISRDIELLDIKGSVIQRWKNIRTNSIQFKDVRAGLYLVKVTEGSTGKVIMKKIVINK